MNDKWYGLLLVEASESHTFFKRAWRTLEAIIFDCQKSTISVNAKPEKVAEDIIDCVLRFGYEQSTGLFA